MMKWLNDYKAPLMSISVVTFLFLCFENAYGDFIIGQAVNIEPPVCSSYDDSSPFISADNLSLFFASNRPGGSGDFDLWVCSRTSTNTPWSEPINLSQMINTSSIEWHPSITVDGLELYFDSDRPGGQGSWDLWVSKRSSTQEDWGTPINLGPVINTSLFEESSSISGDGLMLLWNSKRPGGFGDSDIWMSTRSSRDDAWGEPVNLGPAINTDLLESNAVISADSLAIFFTAWPWPDGYGNFDIWFSRRNSVDDEWITPINLGPAVNTTFAEYCPNISADGRTLYFSDWPAQRPGGYGAEDIWQASIEPVVDFNNDGNINTDDLLILMNQWNTDESLCDIGPMPWGDGVVDMNDLTVFIEYWEKENMPQEPKDEQ
jgi:Tol biopolymer transport system component